MVRFARSHMKLTDKWDGLKLYIKENGKRLMTPMFLVIVALGTTDLIFALDSIPAIYGLTQEPYLVFTANVFALMGLRQLYFLLGDLLKRLVYLSQGLAFILAFIGVKLVLHALHENELPFINGGEHVPVPEIPTLLSLGVIIVTLIITTVASLYKTRVVDKKDGGGRREPVMVVEMVDGVSTVRFDHPPVNALDLDLLDDVIAAMRGRRRSRRDHRARDGASRRGSTCLRSSRAAPSTPTAS